MARKTATIIIDSEGRDLGKAFVLTEMSASAAERWATRTLLALGRSGVDIPDDVAESGLAGVAAIGIRALSGLPWELAEPLMDEMFRCVAFMPNPAQPLVVRPLIEDDIEEVATRVRLREEVIFLHMGFSIRAWLLKLRQALMTVEPTPRIPISPPPLVE